MAKFELIKEVKPNGDIYYKTYQDGHYVETSVIYAGNTHTSDSDDLKDAFHKAREMYEKIVESGGVSVKTILISTEKTDHESKNNNAGE